VTGGPHLVKTLPHGAGQQADDFRAAQKTPLSHIERELVEMKYLTGGHQNFGES